MDNVKEEDLKPSSSTSDVKLEDTKDLKKENIEKDSNELKYFECSICNIREKYEYLGKSPPFYKCFTLLEDSYVIQDPFEPAKQGNILILGSHCIKCNIMVCKDANCSLYYNGTYCIYCAKKNSKEYPKVVQEKLNKIIV